MAKRILQPAKIDWQNQGTPVSKLFDDIYFSTKNGLDETRYVFLQGNRLPERFLTCENHTFTVAETGFGTGLNFLVLWQSFLQFRRQHPEAPLKQLRFISFERHPLTVEDLTTAHRYFPSLVPQTHYLQTHWPEPSAGLHTRTWESIQLDLIYGDVNDMISTLDPQFDAADVWFLDGFAPQKNPDMWTTSLFEHIFTLTRPSGTFATFTAAGFVRRGLQQVGFEVTKRKGYANKRDMLIGQKNINMSQYQQDLSKR